MSPHPLTCPRPAPRHAPRARARPAGFTLVELVVVILVLAIAAGLAAPMLTSDSRAKLTQAARLLASDIDFARIDTIAHGDDRREIVFGTPATDTPAVNTYRLVAASDPSMPLANPVGGHPYVTTFGRGRAGGLEGVTIADLDLGSDGDPTPTLAFGLYGQLEPPTAASIILACRDRRLTLTIDAATGETAIGQVR